MAGLPAGLVLLLLFLPGILSAQSVSVSIGGGVVSMTSSQVYFDRYVAHAFDYGFVWLDTVTLTAGYVGVAGKCGAGVPVPITNLYFVADCNGIGTLAYDRATAQLVVQNFSGQCSVSSGCGGPKSFPWPLGFTPGSWTFGGTAACDGLRAGCADSGQTADLQGRKWTLSGTGNIYVWTVVVTQTDLIPSFTMPSSVAKGGVFTLTNTSLVPSGGVVSSVEFAVDTNSADPTSYTSTLQASFWTALSGGTASLTAPGTPGSYYVHLRYNYTVAGTSKTALITKPLTVTPPLQLGLSGPATGTTGSLVSFNVTGGGPTTTYSWNWGDCPTCNPGFVAGPASNMHGYSSPGSFLVQVQTTDGTNLSASANITITTPPPGPVSVSLSPAFASGVSGQTLNFAASASGGTGNYSYSWNCGTGGGLVPGGFPQKSCFYPATGGYGVQVSVSDGSTTASASSSVTITDTPQPGPLAVGVQGPSSGAIGSPISFTALPSGGTGSYSTYAWNCQWNAQAPGSGFVGGSQTTACTYPSAGTFTVAARVTDSAGTVAVSPGKTVTITSTPPLAATVQGPSAGSIGSLLGFSASASGGTAPYSYAWNCQWNAAAPSSGFITGSQAQTCSYSAAGTFIVVVRVTDSTGVNANSPGIGVLISVNGTSPLTVGVQGPSTASTGTPSTFMAIPGGGNGVYSYAWNCQWTASAGTSGFVPGQQTTTCTYSTSGAYTVIARVTDGTGNVVYSTGNTINILGGLPPVVVRIQGPSTGTKGVAVGVSASATGGVPPYNYAWACDYDPNNPLAGFVAAPAVTTCTYSAAGSYLVVARVSDSANASAASDPQSISIQNTPPLLAPCIPTATTLCLTGGRFSVQATWVTADNRSGSGQAVALTSDTGYFWFFSPTSVEIVAKIVDGRAVNSEFWVFAGGLTDVSVSMTVTDTQTGAVKAYNNPPGTPFQPIQDTSAFSASGSSTSMEDAATSHPNSPPALDTSGPACTADSTTLCLSKGRFKVQTQWAGDGLSGAGQATSLTSDTGYFWFFSPNSVEMIAKVVDACGLNSGFWVFAGGLTNVSVTMTVTDTQTGATRIYNNPQGTPFQPVQDTSAFGSCP